MGVLTPPWNREELTRLSANSRRGRSEAGNHGVSEKVRREDETDKYEVGEYNRVNPKVYGADQMIQGTLVLYPKLLFHPDSSRGCGERKKAEGEKEVEA